MSTPSPVPVPVISDRHQKVREHFRKWPAKTTMSMASSGLLTLYVYFFFWRVPLWFASVENVVYSWGGVLAALIIFAVLKIPRVMTQTSGDETVPISEVLSVLLPLLFLAFVAGRVSTSAMDFPAQGQFGFWMMLLALLIAVGGNIYYSMRLAERTYEGG